MAMTVFPLSVPSPSDCSPQPQTSALDAFQAWVVRGRPASVLVSGPLVPAAWGYRVKARPPHCPAMVLLCLEFPPAQPRPRTRKKTSGPWSSSNRDSGYLAAEELPCCVRPTTDSINPEGWLLPSAESFRGVGYRAGDVGEQIQWGIPQALSAAHSFPGATGRARHAGQCLLTVGGGARTPGGEQGWRLWKAWGRIQAFLVP